MNRVKQLLVGLMLVLLGVVLGVWSVPFLADPVRFPPKAAPQDSSQAAVALRTREPAPLEVDARMAGMLLGVGMRRSEPAFAVSTSGRISGRAIVELPELLNSPFVQALLELSEKQKEEIRKLNGVESKAREPESSGVDIARSLESVTAQRNRVKDREAILNEKQLSMTRRILCQLNQEYSFADPQVAAELSITSSQQAEMQLVFLSSLPPASPEEQQAIGLLTQQASHLRLATRMGNQAARNAPTRLQGADKAEEVVRERNRKLAEAFPAVCQKLRDVLTPEQQRHWDAMQGVRLEAWELDEIRGGVGEAMVATQP